MRKEGKAKNKEQRKREEGKQRKKEKRKVTKGTWFWSLGKFCYSIANVYNLDFNLYSQTKKHGIQWK